MPYSKKTHIFSVLIKPLPNGQFEAQGSMIPRAGNSPEMIIRSFGQTEEEATSRMMSWLNPEELKDWKE